MMLAPFLTAVCVPTTNADVALSGRYLEARTASVFAGACHYNGELVSDGREAVLAWSFEAGSFAGVDFTGRSLAALVVDDENLSFGPRVRRSVLYVTAATPSRETQALVEWAVEAHRDVLGHVVGVRFTDVALSIEDESFALDVAGVCSVNGSAMPDRACCKMPFQVWYTPFEPTLNRLVGLDERFTLDEPLLERRWSRPGENAAFFGRFAR
ncbi:MAG: DUF1326 domain-containing protein [Planctomycetota bacterium]|nr:DUF1326 domain-containing protein [Planctomycetota bacterium]